MEVEIARENKSFHKSQQVGQSHNRIEYTSQQMVTISKAYRVLFPTGGVQVCVCVEGSLTNLSDIYVYYTTQQVR